MFYFYWKDREEVFLKPDPLTPNINLYAPTPLKRTLEIFFRLISANQMSRILKQSRDITIDFHPLFSSISLLSPKSTPLTGDGHSRRRVSLSPLFVSQFHNLDVFLNLVGFILLCGNATGSSKFRAHTDRF